MRRSPHLSFTAALLLGVMIATVRRLVAPDAAWWDASMIVLLVLVLVLYLGRAWLRRR
jgi:hypothetical protein